QGRRRREVPPRRRRPRAPSRRGRAPRGRARRRRALEPAARRADRDRGPQRPPRPDPPRGPSRDTNLSKGISSSTRSGPLPEGERVGHAGCFPPCKFSRGGSTMASKSVFKSYRGKLVPRATAVNEAGGPAYALPPKGALAQYIATGCLNATFYAGGEAQLD